MMMIEYKNLEYTILHGDFIGATINGLVVQFNVYLTK
jgi:hypothetical protein